MKYLQVKEISPKQSKIKSLDQFLDHNGLLRVGGRVRKANIKFDKKIQIMLPQRHHLTNLIILDQHYKQLHPGPQTIIIICHLRTWHLHTSHHVKRTEVVFLI